MMDIQTVMSYMTTNNMMLLLLLLLIFFVIATLVKLTLNPHDSLDLKDLVCVDNQLDEKKFTRFGAWIVSTWGFVYILVSKPEAFPEWYFVGYMGVWVTNAIFDKYMTKKAQNLDRPPQK